MEGSEIDWDKIEDAGHEFTIISGPVAGRSIYYCENCTTIMVLCNTRPNMVAVWQSPHGNAMCAPRRSKDKTLKEKLAELDQELLKAIEEL